MVLDVTGNSGDHSVVYVCSDLETIGAEKICR